MSNTDNENNDMKLLKFEADYFELVQNIGKIDIADLSVYLSFKPETQAQKDFVKSYYLALYSYSEFTKALVAAFEEICKQYNLEYC